MLSLSDRGLRALPKPTPMTLRLPPPSLSSTGAGCNYPARPGSGGPLAALLDEVESGLHFLSREHFVALLIWVNVK
jgi:hypothetical protein